MKRRGAGANQSLSAIFRSEKLIKAEILIEEEKEW
jgi:hypothetical protein